jgi:hypothetical protein
MHAHADMSYSLLFPEFTMSPDPESSLKFDHSSQALLLGSNLPTRMLCAAVGFTSKLEDATRA